MFPSNKQREESQELQTFFWDGRLVTGNCGCLGRVLGGMSPLTSGQGCCVDSPPGGVSGFPSGEAFFRVALGDLALADSRLESTSPPFQHAFFSTDASLQTVGLLNTHFSKRSPPET